MMSEEWGKRQRLEDKEWGMKDKEWGMKDKEWGMKDKVRGRDAGLEIWNIIIYLTHSYLFYT